MRQKAQGDISHLKWGISSYPSGVKKAVLVPLRMFSFKSSTAEALAVPFRVLSEKNMTEGLVPQIQATPTKQDLGTCQGFFSKFLTSSLRSFYTGVPLPVGLQYQEDGGGGEGDRCTFQRLKSVFAISWCFAPKGPKRELLWFLSGY